MEALHTDVLEPDTDLSKILEELEQNEESVADEPRLRDVMTDESADMFCTWQIGLY